MSSYKTPQEAWLAWSRADVKKFKVAMYKLANGQFAAYVNASNTIPPGAVRMSPQPPYPRSKDPREGTKQAMQKLEAKHTPYIDWACHLAVQLARKNLTVHTRAVREEMERRNLVGPDTGAEFWLGASMNKLAKMGILERSGHTYKYSDSSRGIHERTVTVWQLKDDADTSYYDEEPDPL